MPSKNKIVILGCGNLAWHLASRLVEKKNISVSVYNHRLSENLQRFKKKLHCKTGDFKKIESNADVYFICVSDDAISKVSKKLKGLKNNSLVVHTSGAKGIEEIAGAGGKKAVMYPLQTFSSDEPVHWKKTPLLLEAEDQPSQKKLKKIADLFSSNSFFVNSTQRKKIHLAAVLVNNFPNALYVAAGVFLKKELKDKSFNFKQLLPLIEQGQKKLRKMSPLEAQTGPARRGDRGVIQAHLRLLQKDPVLKKIYSELTHLIEQQQA